MAVDVSLNRTNFDPFSPAQNVPSVARRRRTKKLWRFLRTFLERFLGRRRHSSLFFLQFVTAGGAGGEGPLEVVAAEVSGDIEGFADDVQTGDVAGFEGLG